MDATEAQERGKSCKGRCGHYQHIDGTTMEMDKIPQFKKELLALVLNAM